MSRSRLVALLSAPVLLAAGGGLAPTPGPPAAAGPNNAQPCDIVGDLYTPATASATSRVPAILTTNGFGGSKDDQAGIGREFAALGYVVLSYSGLGFGGSGCKI